MKDFVLLNNGVKIPRLGFGCDRLKGDEVISAVTKAIELGYRLFDTAHLYCNETEVAIAIRNCIDRGIVKREDIFITSKAPFHLPGYQQTLDGFEESLKNFKKGGIDSIDMYLLHSPYWDYFDWKEKVIDSYRALETLYSYKKLKAIGYCNFYDVNFIDRIAKVYPQIHQFECNPQRQNKRLCAAGKEYNIQSEAWGPLNQGRLFDSDIIKKIADKYGKTVAQVALRWNLQLGNVVLVRSSNLQRIEENFNIWDFELTEDDMQEIQKLDGKGSGRWPHSENGEETIPIGKIVNYDFWQKMKLIQYFNYEINAEKVVKLFGIIPIIKLKMATSKTKIYFLGIPIMTIRSKDNTYKDNTYDNKISIIMPIKNGENYMREAIDGIKKQNKDIEIIIINDGSTDNTAQVAKSLGCKVINHAVSKGQVVAKNTALKEVSGDYVMFHDHDDILTSHALETMLSEFEKDSSLEVVIAKIKDFISPDAKNQNQVIKTEPYYGCLAGSILFKKEVFDKIGLFDENLTAGEIISLMSKFEEFGIRTKKIDFVSSNRRIHDNNYGKTNKIKEFNDYASILRKKLSRKSTGGGI